ncbi:MAG: hypothetical protein EOO60_06895 [Hymenobacter sp.]|nr:MAG: hypothetical protein EOO60_06895 [Hymenobacter sp.]
MAKRSKHPFLFIEENTKVWVRDDSQPVAACVEGKACQPIILPPSVGVLSESLAFPLYMVRNAAGRDVPAEAQVWDTMLVSRILQGGDFHYHLLDVNPSKNYCLQLLRFHFSKLLPVKQYEFAPYIRHLLEGAQAKLEADLDGDAPGWGHCGEWADATQASSDLLQYCIDRFGKQSSQTRARLLNANKASEPATCFTGKVKTLAYLILLKSGLEPSLPLQAAGPAVQEHIVKKTGLNSRTVNLYIRATPDWNSNYYIYTEENKDLALEYIEENMPEVNKTQLKFPRTLRGGVQSGKKK